MAPTPRAETAAGRYGYTVAGSGAYACVPVAREGLISSLLSFALFFHFYRRAVDFFDGAVFRVIFFSTNINLFL